MREQDGAYAEEKRELLRRAGRPRTGRMSPLGNPGRALPGEERTKLRKQEIGNHRQRRAGRLPCMHALNRQIST